MDLLSIEQGFCYRSPPGPGAWRQILCIAGPRALQHDASMVQAPGVVLGRKGTLGKVFYLDEDFWPHDTTLWVKQFNGNYPRFVYYFFTNLDVIQLDSGAAIQRSIEIKFTRLRLIGHQ